MRLTCSAVAGAAVLAACLLLAGSVPALADATYEIGPEDVLSITVWEHPELSRTVVVRADGSATVPPLGDVRAAGKTTETLARDLEARIHGVLRIGTQVTVAVVSFNSRQVFLAGQVANPGRYSFEEIPGLIDLLGSAGGLNATADLTNVRVLRKREGGAPETITVDVSNALRTGNLQGMPPLQPGDVVYVPGAAAGGPGQVVGEGGVYVIGDVARPGVYSTIPGMNVLQLLSVAGGMLPTANLSRVQIMSATPDGTYSVRVDLGREMADGRGGPEIRTGDTVIVPSLQAGRTRMAWGIMRETLGVSRDVLNLFLIRDVLDDE